MKIIGLKSVLERNVDIYVDIFFWDIFVNQNKHAFNTNNLGNASFSIRENLQY